MPDIHTRTRYSLSSRSRHYFAFRVFRREETARESLRMVTSLVGLHTCTYIRVYCYFANRLHSVFFAFRRESTRKRKSLQSLTTVLRTNEVTRRMRTSKTSFLDTRFFLFLHWHFTVACATSLVLSGRVTASKKTEEKFWARYFRHPRTRRAGWR